MVMHARKVARLDDGYRDLNQPEIISKDKSLSNSHTKYGERKKFEGFDHRRRSNSPRSFQSRSGHYENKPRERRNYEDNDNSGNKDNKTKEQKHKDHKSEVHRLAERVCGDWSEHISKSGKRYFYNCRTEVSQWEKPDCWIEENSTKNSDKVQQDASDRSKSSSSSKANSHIGELKFSANNKTSSASKPTARRDDRGAFREDQRSPPKNSLSALSKDVNPALLRERALIRQDRKRPFSRRSSSRSPTHSQMYGSRGSSSEGGSGGYYRNSSSGKNDPSSAGNGGMARKRDGGLMESGECDVSKVLLDGKEADDSRKNSPVHEDMDISPDNSFSQTEIETRTSHDGLNSKSSPHQILTSTPSGMTAINNNGDTSSVQSDQPSLQAAHIPSSSNQESSFSLSASAANTVSGSLPSSNPSTWSGANNALQQQQNLQTTLAGLQQAVLRLIPDKMSASVPGQQSQSSSQANFANCVALLPVLLAQLSNQQQAGSGGSNSDNQLIIQQAIPLLKKLQEIVAHQQQQRKLQQVLFQLLQMQNSSGSNVHPNQSHKTPGNDKVESPYSPPDSDGSPVQTSGHNRHYSHHHHNRQPPTNRQSPRQLQYHQEPIHQVPVLKQMNNRQEKMALHQGSTEDADERIDGVGVHSKMEKNDSRLMANSQLSMSSGGSQTLNHHHHPNIPFYRQTDVQLTPTLVNHFSPTVIEHTTNWQADSLVKQADCIAADNYSYLGPLCAQVSVELKQARSMVRAQEILSTRHEQRRIFIQHQLYELDKELLPVNPIIMTFGQQQSSTTTHTHPHQHAMAIHPPAQPIPTPLSPQVIVIQPPLSSDPCSPIPSQDMPSVSQSTPVAPCENSITDLT